jgi:two-component system NtrC family sensor kinase
VGLGASAGGIQALQTFFQALPPHPGLVFVVVMHLAPERESALPQVLQAATAMPVQQVKERVPMAPDHVYVIPPNQHLKIVDGHLDVSEFDEPRWQRAPIDVFFRTLAEVHPDGIGILLSGSVDRQLTIRLYTPSLTSLFNIMPVDQGRPLEHVTHRLDGVDLRRDVRQVLTTLVPVEREVSLGGEQYYLMRLTLYRTTDDHIDGVVITWVEITRLKRVEQQVRERETQLRALTETLEQRVAERTAALEATHDQLREEMAERQRMQEALFQREKLAALGLLLANVAHELNNPLSVATMEVDNLAEVWPDHLETEALDTLRQAVERCGSVVQSFLALARQQSTSRQSVDLHALIDEVLILLRHALEADCITLELRLAQDLPLLQADANQLHHVISNLITNAHQALRHSEAPRQLTLTTAGHPAGTQVTLEVADTGPGIPDDLQRRIFEPFFTTRPQDGGSSLGLSLCRSVIETHGGTIRVSSQVGQGTTIHITLPVEPPAEAQSSEASGDTEMPDQTRRGRLLLIDDEASVRRALQRLLERSGHDLALASNGREGLAALQGQAYEVILCDIRMPDLDGPGFYREVARVYPHLVSRLIFLTGDVLSPEVQAFFDQVGCPRLIKPFQAREVRRLIQHLLETP